MGGLRSILSIFRNDLNIINKTRARILDSIYLLTLRILLNLNSAKNHYNFVIMNATLVWTS